MYIVFSLTRPCPSITMLRFGVENFRFYKSLFSCCKLVQSYFTMILNTRIFSSLERKSRRRPTWKSTWSWHSLDVQHKLIFFQNIAVFGSSLLALKLSLFFCLFVCFNYLSFFFPLTHVGHAPIRLPHLR